MKKAFFAILATVLIGQITAQALPSSADFFAFLAPTDRQVLFEKGEITSTGSKLSDLRFAGSSPWNPTIQEAWKGRDTTVSVEGLYVFDLPKAPDQETRLLKVFNALNAVSTMAGLQYFSVSQQKMETLILSSSRVESVEKNSPLPDQSFTAVPASSRTVVFQKDNRLGDGFSELLFSRQGASLVLAMKNLTGLNYGIFPLVATGDLQMLFIVTPLKDKVSVYGVMGVKTGSFFGMERSKDESFRNRMKALAGWLRDQVRKS